MEQGIIFGLRRNKRGQAFFHQMMRLEGGERNAGYERRRGGESHSAPEHVAKEEQKERLSTRGGEQMDRSTAGSFPFNRHTMSHIQKRVRAARYSN